jgi:hypothetical protein
MSAAYADLRDLASFRPMDSALAVGRSLVERKRSPFRASWGSTVTLLARELRMLKTSNVWIELDIAQSDFRIDGLPRASARQITPAVVVSMDTRHGALRYSVDTYDHWEDNLRAVALGLEALRAVDRYGVTKRGEQYAGWRALPAGSQRSAEYLYERGRQIVAEHGDSIRAAVRATHPDHGGSREDFDAVMAVKALAATTLPV